MLENENGKMERMVQRVVRQAQEAQLTNDITLATNILIYKKIDRIKELA